MIVYVFMIISTVIMTTGIKKAKKLENKGLELGCKIMIFLIPFLIMSLRYDVGQDYLYTYVPIFETVKAIGEYNNVEFGYVLLNKLVLLFTNDYAGIFMLTSAIFCVFIYKAIMRSSKDITLSFYILFASCFFFYAMNVMRQSIVIAIFIYCIRYIKERNVMKYMMIIILASFIHKIALIFIPVYFVSYFKIKPKLLIIIAIVVVIAQPLIYNLIVKFTAGTKYENYITGRYSVSESSMISPLINFSTLILCYYYKQKDKKNGEFDDELNILTNIHILALICSLLLGSFPLASRIFVNFYHVQILTIPLLLSKEKRKDIRRLLYLGYYMAFGFNFIYSVGMKNGNKVLPYRTIFDR
ncbi:putative uncharacterized protein [Clostridium sp. CAG:273]|nr:EpsG family protein [Clostridia bacterium]CDE83499.1 putative uncharacterized protein [Clostridium sp. CAG:273]